MKMKPTPGQNDAIVDALIDTIRDQAIAILHETGLSPRELLEQRDNLLEWLDTLTLVVGLTPIAGNKEALQEAMNGARAAIAATKPEAVKGGEG